MELQSTESKFKNLVLARGIVKASGELKNLSEACESSVLSNLNKSARLGLLAEKIVHTQLKNRSWKLLFHRARTKAGEIDFIFEKGNRIILLEVKSLHQDWHVFQRYHPQQQLRLKANTYLFRKNFTGYQINSYVAWVRPDKKIHYALLG